MKLNYLPKNRFNRPYFKQILILVLIFVLSVTTFSFIGDPVIFLASRVWKTEGSVVRIFHNWVAFFSSQQKLQEENILLKERISSLEYKISSLTTEQEQGKILIELFNQKTTPNIVIAAILTHPPQSPYDTIIIDAGSNDSIFLGSEVFLSEGPILGLISEVFSNTAKVKLYSTNGEKINAVLERGGEPVTLVGAGGGNFTIVVPQGLEIEKGDRILSADINSRHLATVGEINVKPTDSFKEVLAKSPINIFTIRYVFVKP